MRGAAQKREKKRKRRKCGEAIGHRALWGRCQKKYGLAPLMVSNILCPAVQILVYSVASFDKI